MTRVILLAAGDGTRWGDFLGGPKHLAPIDGTPIIHRTVKLFSEAGIPESELFVVVSEPLDARYAVSGSTLAQALLEPENGEIDKFLSSQHLWNENGRTLLVYGDTYLTREAVATILAPIDYPAGWHWYCRFWENPYTGRSWGENFAIGLDPYGLVGFEEHARSLIGYGGRNGGWELYRLMTRGDAAEPHGDYGYATDITDWSDDLDYPADWVEMVSRRAIAGVRDFI